MPEPPIDKWCLAFTWDGIAGTNGTITPLDYGYDTDVRLPALPIKN